MAGSVEDWDSLVTKIKAVREILEPIKRQIGLCDDWWDHVLYVFQNLANTRREPNNPDVAKFWNNILMNTTVSKMIGNPCMAGPSENVHAYNGWLVMLLTGQQKLRSEDLYDDNDITKRLSGWNRVPLSIIYAWATPPIKDEATLVAGILGVKVHGGQNMDDWEELETEQVPFIEANHVWAMLLSPDSKLRG